MNLQQKPTPKQASCFKYLAEIGLERQPPQLPEDGAIPPLNIILPGGTLTSLILTHRAQQKT